MVSSHYKPFFFNPSIFLLCNVKSCPQNCSLALKQAGHIAWFLSWTFMGLNCEIANVTQRYRGFHKKFLVSMDWNFSKGGELCHCLIGVFLGGEGTFFSFKENGENTDRQNFGTFFQKKRHVGFVPLAFRESSISPHTHCWLIQPVCTRTSHSQ